MLYMVLLKLFWFQIKKNHEYIYLIISQITALWSLFKILPTPLISVDYFVPHPKWRVSKYSVETKQNKKVRQTWNCGTQWQEERVVSYQIWEQEKQWGVEGEAWENHSFKIEWVMGRLSEILMSCAWLVELSSPNY